MAPSGNVGAVVGAAQDSSGIIVNIVNILRAGVVSAAFPKDELLSAIEEHYGSLIAPDAEALDVPAPSFSGVESYYLGYDETGPYLRMEGVTEEEVSSYVATLEEAGWEDIGLASVLGYTAAYANEGMDVAFFLAYDAKTGTLVFSFNALSANYLWDSEYVALCLEALGISEVASLARSLSQLNTRVDVSNSLQIVYHLTPLSAELRIPVAAALDYVHRFLTDAEMQFAHRELLPLHVLTALREGRGAESFSADTQSRLKRFLACLVVNDLLRFDNLERTKQIFGLSKGVLQGVQTACRVFYHTNLRVLKCLHYDLLYEVFKGFEMHMATDLTPETLALVNLGVAAWLVARHTLDRAELRNHSNE